VTEKSRREQLEEFVAKKPDDAFLRYALALEYRSAGQNDQALVQFKTLIEKNESYVPAYLMWGQLLNQLTRIDEARAVLEKGMAVAQRVGNAHALSEMQELHASL
jgi:thioredoxin-like negative regulator of GroEL